MNHNLTHNENHFSIACGIALPVVRLSSFADNQSTVRMYYTVRLRPYCASARIGANKLQPVATGRSSTIAISSIFRHARMYGMHT